MKRITSLLLAIVLFAGLVLTCAPTAHAASNMKVSDDMLDFLKSFEGFSAKPYWDNSQYTVGYGTRCPDDMLEEYRKNGISVEAAETLLRNYLSGTESVINKKLIDAHGLTLTQGQFDAIASFTYNCGSAWIYQANSMLHRAILKGTTGSDLIHAFTVWCKSGGEVLNGLVRRRLCEANMYLNGEYTTKIPEDFCYVRYNANGGTTSDKIQGYHADDGVAPVYTATNSGREFLGWYTAKTGGSKVTKLTKANSGDTLYARWEGDAVDPVPENGVAIEVTANSVNLRKGPGTNYGIVGSAGKGDELVITETADGSGYTWGKAGEKWIALKYTNYDEAIKGETTTPPETEDKEEETPDTETPETPETPDATKPTPVTGTVKANGGLSVRKGPGTGYARVRYLSNGAKITILDQQTVGTMTWGQVSDGWISMSYVILDPVETEPEPEAKPEDKPETEPEDKPEDKPETEPEDKPEDKPETEPEAKPEEKPEAEPTVRTGTIKASGGLALRRGPGLSYSRIKYLANGTKVTIQEQQEVEGTSWGNIGSGWISMKYVVLDPVEAEPEAKPEDKPETEPEAKPEEKPETDPEEQPDTAPPAEEEKDTLTGTIKAVGGLAVRRDAGTNYGIKRYLNNGVKVTITDVKEVGSTKWGNIGDGWICMDYVVLDDQQSGDTDSTVKTGTVSTSCLRVRKEPSTSAKIVGYYYRGATVQISDTRTVGSTTWGKTPKGWVSMEYVK